ncbi:MAG: hypothetical protein A3K19_27065 [Lentisphaerae bacterium RIFOXYB12_FULL_65_16]|nr:MAG: hypothetical protein A3K18_16635 [Lentisphaerae bacterium RIFOXYA12_64_32]OGV84629.1 MAG: hypothetical protein A3K19_27065 [Lentisphaerae bacterium RIFOXYB12_FULL_65_16]
MVTVLGLAAQNPEAEAALHRWRAATQKRPQAMTLPDPRVEATSFYVRDRDRYMLSVTQDIPYPGKLILAGRIADREAEIARLRYQAAIRDALSAAKEAYFELYYIDRAQAVTREIRDLYDRYAALAVGGNAVGRTNLPETFRAESQRAQLGYDLVLLEEMRRAESARLRAVLGLPATVAIGVTEDVADPVEIADPFDRLRELATLYNQDLAAAGVDVERAQAQRDLARRAPIPDLMIGTNYTRMVDGMEKDHTAGVTVGLTIPLWFGKYRAQNREAVEMLAAAQAEEDAQRLKVDADLASTYFSLSNSSRLVRLYHNTLLPQARQALQSAEELYRQGNASMAAVLETTATVHNFELARLRATADFYQNMARLERVLGTAFQLKPRTPAPDANAAPPAKEGQP